MDDEPTEGSHLIKPEEMADCERTYINERHRQLSLGCNCNPKVVWTREDDIPVLQMTHDWSCHYTRTKAATWN